MRVGNPVAVLFGWFGGSCRPLWPLGGMLLAATTSWAQPVPDADTLLLAQFDRSADADYSLGTPAANTMVETTGPAGGRFGGGVDLSEGERITLVGNDGNFNAPRGTIEFWIKPHWPGNDPETHRFLSLPMGEKKYINVNTLGGGRFGFAIAAGEGDGWAWRRADADISNWQPETWHHMAFTWGEGQMRVYVDGQEGVRSVNDAPMPAEPPEEIGISGGDAVIDALRISKRMFSAEDVRRSIAQAENPPYRYLSDFRWTPAEAVTTDRRTLLGELSIPLILGSAHYLKGIACRPGASISTDLSESYGMLQARVGLCALSPPDAACAFEVWGDGKKVFESDPRTPGQPPLEIRVPIVGVKQLRLATRSEAAKGRLGHAIWAGSLVKEGVDTEPLLSSRPLKPEQIETYRRQEAANDYLFRPRVEGPYFVAAKFWEDDMDPASPPPAENVDRPLEGFATPGEFEPLNFVVYAVDDLEQMTVEASDLRAGDSILPGSCVDVRIVLRGLMRDIYTFPPERSTVVSRFLLPYRALDVPAGTFREYHLIVHVPDDAAAGRYTGQVRIAPRNQSPLELPVTFEVLPFQFRPLREKAYGVYYRFPAEEEDWPKIEVELADIRAHGATMLKSSLGVGYEAEEGRIAPSYERLERGLALLAKHGFRGPLPVGSGCEQAARLLGYDLVEDYNDRPARDRFYKLVKEAMEGLVALSAKYPQFELLPTHMDEVFGRGRLPRYIRLTEAVRQVPSLRVYITMHNDPKRDVEDMMRQCDPYVDVRCYNGHAMDNWIRAGNTFEDLRRQLEEAGDEAWLYHNIRGSFFKAEWTRLVNGYYLWISPLRVHVPWMYYSFKGNPFDATDGPRLRGGDFAYAVPDPHDPTRMVPTRHWEAFREGIDDLHYLDLLESLAAEHPGTAEAAAARTWLENLRRGVTPKPDELKPIEEESPLLVWLSGKLDGPMYRKIRRQAARHIQRLAALSN